MHGVWNITYGITASACHRNALLMPCKKLSDGDCFVRCCTLLYVVVLFEALLSVVLSCCMLSYIAARCYTLENIVLRSVDDATHWPTKAARHYPTLRHVAPCYVLPDFVVIIRFRAPQDSALFGAALYCNTLQDDAIRTWPKSEGRCFTLPRFRCFALLCLRRYNKNTSILSCAVQCGAIRC